MQLEPSIVEAAIAQWRQWQVSLPGKPEIVCPLGAGLSNQSFLLQAGEIRLVLRINNQDGQLSGIDRQREAVIWQAAFEAGIAPALLHAQDGYLVSRFVAGSPPNLANQVFAILEKCHAIQIDTHQIDYAKHIQTYWDRIEQSSSARPANVEAGTNKTDPYDIHALNNKRPAMQECLLTLSAQQPSPVLCHHDPVKANFVGPPERLYLIDWEYAALGMAIMDYAAVALEWGFSDAAICARANIKPDSLVMAKKLYQYMCQLWAAAQP